MPESHVLWEMLGSFTFISIIGHAVNTFPVPENAYGKWLLGLVQWIVGQRTQAAATKMGMTLPAITDPAPSSQNQRLYGDNKETK